MHYSLECIKEEKFRTIQAEKTFVQFLNKKLDQLIFISYFNPAFFLAEPFRCFRIRSSMRAACCNANGGAFPIFLDLSQLKFESGQS